MWLIFCKERSRDGIACWWRPSRRGYTDDVNQAGRYEKDFADEVCRDSRGNDFPVPEEAIGSSLAPKLIVDIHYANNRLAIDGFNSVAMGKTEGQSK